MFKNKNINSSQILGLFLLLHAAFALENSRKVNVDLTAGIISADVNQDNANLLVTNIKSENNEGSDNHICSREEDYIEQLHIPSIQPVRIRSSTWCMEFPPRCSSYKTEMRQIMKTQVRNNIWKIKKV